MNTDNIILFPKWRKILEEESLQALKEKRYELALKKLDQLIQYQVEDFEILTGKLICLMELGRLAEAQSLCEEILTMNDENYLHYIHIYLTILFQTNQYELLMDQVRHVLDNEQITPLQREQFRQLFHMSEKMKVESEEEEVTLLLNKFYRIVGGGNYQLEWHYIERLKKLQARPEEKMMEFLAMEKIHPVIKTAIFQWLQEYQATKPVRVHKFDQKQTFIPNEVEEWHKSDCYTVILSHFAPIEETNPTLFHVMKKLLHHYMYVLYPFFPLENDYINVAEALTNLGEEYLGIRTNSKGEQREEVTYFMEFIQYAETLYSSVIED